MKETFNINESSLALLNDIKLYLSTIRFQPLSEIFSEIPEALLQTNVNNVSPVANLSFPEDSNPKSLTLTCDSENSSTSLSKKTLGNFGLSIDGFLSKIKAIQDTNSNNTLKEAIEKIITAFYKKYSENQLPYVILQHTQLYEKLRLLNPTYSKEKVFEHIDDLLKKDSSRELTLISDQFSRAYQGKHGFSTIFGSEEDRMPYTITQKLIENSDAELTAYLNIIHTIEKLPIYLQDKTAAKQLVNELKHLSDNYFSNLLKINSSENTVETKRNERMKAFKDFRIDSYHKIERYKDDHPKESIKATNFLDKLLWLITKLVPLISRETRMMMFGGHTKASLSFENISQEVNKIAPAA